MKIKYKIDGVISRLNNLYTSIVRGERASKSSGIERARASDVRAHSSSSKLEHQMIEHIRVRASIEHQILKKILVFWSLE